MLPIMCGIAGIATRDGLREGDAHLADAMLRSLAHRGPDDQHVAGDSKALIGARRLSIIDLEGGRQPLTDESGLILATQNGEIYNYIELRRDLERQGHVFRTRSDTETIVHLYEQHGTAFVRQLRGMFAIAIWDGRTDRLVLARDRLGKKPLYWRLSDGRLTYGSELKAVLQDPSVERVVDREALDLYLQYQYVPAPWTILRGVAKLAPASTLVWDGGQPSIERYWIPDYVPKARRDFREDLDEGLSILREAVRLRLRSDVPVGVFLSGGMDSDGRHRAHGAGVDAAGAYVLDRLREPGVRRAPVCPGGRATLRDGPHGGGRQPGRDRPSCPSSPSTTTSRSRIRPHCPPSASRSWPREHLKVVLTGDGGDESFGGYERYRLNAVFGALERVPSPLLRAAARSGRTALAPFGSRSRLRRRLGRAEILFGLDCDERYDRPDDDHREGGQVEAARRL